MEQSYYAIIGVLTLAIAFSAIAIIFRKALKDPNDGIDLTPSKDVYVKKSIMDPKAVWKFDKDEPSQVFLLSDTPDKRLEKHVGIMVDDVALIVAHGTDVGDIRKYIHATYSELLDKLYNLHRSKDYKQLDKLYNKHQLAMWNDFSVHTMVHMNFSNVNLVL